MKLLMKGRLGQGISTARRAASSLSLKQQPIQKAGRGELVRDFIDKSLYARDAGYFNTHNCIYTPKQPVDFTALVGKSEYQNLLVELYDDSSDGWLTPTELYQPHYGEAILKWILNAHLGNGEPLHIVEIGGGSGTSALTILNCLQRDHPQLYKTATYTIVERSVGYAEAQKRLLVDRGHGARMCFEQMSITDWVDETRFKDKHCFVFALEVLDNMPHDKLIVETDGTINQVHVIENKDPDSPMVYVEDSRPVCDEWIRQYIEATEGHTFPDPKERFRGWWRRTAERAANVFGRSPEHVWIPTVSFHFLDVLHRYFPSHHLLLADFNFLPDAIDGTCAPVVASKSSNTRGVSITKDDYLIQLGSADIFFPTNFDQLQHLYHHTARKRTAESAETIGDAVSHDGHEDGKDANKESQIWSTAEFMSEFANTSKTETKTGYNPLLEDYGNMCMFTAHTPQVPTSRPRARRNCKPATD